MAETTYATVAEATSPAAAPPTPSATRATYGPRNAESSLVSRTRPTSVTAMPEKCSIRNLRRCTPAGGRVSQLQCPRWGKTDEALIWGA
jgi:hypothetical protein